MDDRGTSDPRGVLVCANPFSGSGPNRRCVDDLAAALSAGGLEPRLVWDLQERGKLLSDPGLNRWCRCVVVAGGDGSIGAVVNELGAAGQLDTSHGSVVSLATLPMGNENLFAGHFRFGCDVHALTGAIQRCRTRRVDLVRAGGRLFTLMAGVGYDGEVVHRMDRWRARGGGLRRVRRLSYLPRLMSSAFGYAYPMLTVDVDGQALAGAHLFVFNLPAYGGGLRLCPPGCVEDDGRLSWVLFERPGAGPLLSYALSVLRGGHLGRADVKHGRALRLGVRTSLSTPAPIQIDGDPAEATPLEICLADGIGLELLIT